MDDLIKVLAPAFAAGLGVQRFLEIIDSIFSGFPGFGDRKKLVMVCASVALATGVSGFGHIRILAHFPLVKQPSASDSQPEKPQQPASDRQPGEPKKCPTDPIDLIVTILFISGGTEGINSLLKFLNYKKEGSKGSAANALSDTEGKKIQGVDALSVVRST